jgi:hypothetical protein
MPYSEIFAVCSDIHAKCSMGKVQGVHTLLQNYEKLLLASSCLSGRNIGWKSKATDTHSKYVTLIALPRQKWLRERTSMVWYTYIACVVNVSAVGITSSLDSWTRLAAISPLTSLSLPGKIIYHSKYLIQLGFLATCTNCFITKICFLPRQFIYMFARFLQ